MITTKLSKARENADGKTWATKSCMVLVLHLIGWGGGGGGEVRNSLVISQCEVMQNQCNYGIFSTLK